MLIREQGNNLSGNINETVYEKNVMKVYFEKTRKKRCKVKKTVKKNQPPYFGKTLLII